MLNEVEERVLARLSERFTMAELESAIEALADDGIDRSMSGETTRFLHWLASSNYRVSFPPSTEISERVLFPTGPTESHGMEDARFVRFVDDDGTVTYYATYTAYDGHQILPQLIETADFSRVPDRHAHRPRGPEQGDGHLSPTDRRPLRRVEPTGQRQQLRHDLDRHPGVA